MSHYLPAVGVAEDTDGMPFVCVVLIDTKATAGKRRLGTSAEAVWTVAR